MLDQKAEAPNKIQIYSVMKEKKRTFRSMFFWTKT